MNNKAFMASLMGNLGVAANTVKKSKTKKAAVPPFLPIGSPIKPVIQPKEAVVDEKSLSDTTAFFLPQSSKSESKFTLQNRLRVACYIRVSSTNPAQEGSYEAQEKYFTSLLAVHDDWRGAGVYSDYGKSGTQKETRTGFNRLVRHCEQGRIDRIIVKSISRFSRNVMDLVEAIRTLKDCNVTVYFERENLDTADMRSEFVLTALAAIAQEESRSISENIRWGNNKRFPKGEVQNVALYGYRYTGKYEITESGYRLKQIEIVGEEAEVVRRIFDLYLSWKGPAEIARILNADRVPAPQRQVHKSSGKRRSADKGVELGWTTKRIASILRSERYCGDVLIQKSYTKDYLTHKSNRRTLRSFFGFKRVSTDGKVDFLDKIWKVNGLAVTPDKKTEKETIE